ncbi:type II toxin-antitoxin system HipA family toxin [Devosia sp.]|uniref:type II toxin-antitoxin system HipA family toxin n=1 Tax=Devosia sp. TaxID=1871048 RepID=UPI002733B1A4|nr:HipA domain-containing protein [Devosia sp.]MDP2782267.1 HipA domain-containing protein [Devosia sp.]
MVKIYSIEDLQLSALSRLDVYVNGKRSATLTKEGNRYALTYLPDIDPEYFVSLTMRVRNESWVSVGRLHPFFEINLPEGARKDALAAAFGKAMVSEEMALLALTGNDTIGRIQVVPAGYPLEWKRQFDFNIEDARQQDSVEFFSDAVKKYAGQGVSGVHPKVLFNSQRTTLKSEKWIAKYDGDELKGLSINEYLSMAAASECGLDVPECELSKDGRTLFVKRFDDGMGFEDFCSLLALSPFEKYKGSYERINKIIGSFVDNKIAFREALLKSHIFNMCIGNADSHLKNYGLIYNHQIKPVLAPFYDLVTVKAFESFKKDIPALTIGGKKEWVIGKSFERMALDWGVKKAKIDQYREEIKCGIEKTIPLVVNIAKRHPWCSEQNKRMVCVWNTGLKRIYGEQVIEEQTDTLESIGFSAIKPTSIRKKENPYRENSPMNHARDNIYSHSSQSNETATDSLNEGVVYQNKP